MDGMGNFSFLTKCGNCLIKYVDEDKGLRHLIPNKKLKI